MILRLVEGWDQPTEVSTLLSVLKREGERGMEGGREAFCWWRWVSSRVVEQSDEQSQQGHWDKLALHALPKLHHFYPMAWQHTGLIACLGYICIYRTLPKAGPALHLGLAILSSASTPLTFHCSVPDCSILVRSRGGEWISGGRAPNLRDT